MDKYLYTPQKAIDKLKRLLPDENQVIIGSRRNGRELELAIHMGIKALEKEVPKKVTRDSMYSPALCPNCHSDEICRDLEDGYYLYFKDIKYCPRCGQMLDWEE